MQLIINCDQEHKLKYLHYLMIFWMCQLLKTNLFFTIGIDNSYIITILFGVMVAALYKKRVLFLSKYVLWYILLISCVLFSIVMTGGALTIGTILHVLGKILFVYVTIMFDAKKFAHRFVKLTYVFSISSLVCWGIYIVFGAGAAAAISRLLYHRGNLYGLFFIGYNFTSTGITGGRNAYLFSEPGVYQLLVNTALYFVLFHEDEFKDKSIKYVIVFIITILTIQSTEGYMIFLMILLAGLLRKNPDRSKALMKIKYALIVFVGIAFTYLSKFANQSSFIYVNFFGKIMNSSNQLDFSQGTAAARYNSFQNFFSFFEAGIDKILFGVGSAGGTGGQYVDTNGMLVLVVYFGLIFAVVFYGYNLYQCMKYSKDFFELICIVFIVICHGMSQPDFMNVMIVLVMLFNPLEAFTQYQCEGDPEYETN